MQGEQGYIIVFDEPRRPRPWYKAILFTTLSAIFCVTGYVLIQYTSKLGFPAEAYAGFYKTVQPIMGPFLQLLKITVPSGNSGSLFAIFACLQGLGLTFLLPALRLKLAQLAEVEKVFGPVNKPAHRWFFAFAALGVLGTMTLALSPAWRGELAIVNFLLSLLRISLFMALGAVSLGLAIVGFSLRKSWKKWRILNAEDLPDYIAPQSHSHADAALPAPTATSDESVYLALAAELVELIGRTNKLPDYRQLQQPLLELQSAASMTHSGQFQSANLAALCREACDLMAKGQLSHLPDVETAVKAYKAHDPSVFIDLATELREKIRK